MRAFIRLVQEGSGKRKVQMPKKLKKMYALAGAIRDAQLQEQRLQQSAAELVPLLRDEVLGIDRAMMEIKSALPLMAAGDVLQKNKKKLIGRVAHAFELPGFAVYFAHQCNAVHQLLHTVPLTDDRIHAIRKILKDLIYNLDVYRKEDEFPPGTWKEKITAYFDPLLEQLGSYQDICTALDFVEVLWLQALHTHYRVPLASLKEKWAEEKSTQRKALVASLTSDRVLDTGRLEAIPISVVTDV